MDFPITELMDEQACYDKLVEWLHTGGLACPRCHRAETTYVHRRDRAPILDYRCRACRCAFNAFTGTELRGTKRRPVALLLILRGFAQGASTARLARELECDRLELLRFRHKLQDPAYRFRDLDPLEDSDVEADEAYQNAGKKVSHTATRAIHLGGGRTSDRATGRMATTGRRCAAWPAATAARSNRRWSGIPTTRRWSGS